MGEAAMSVRAKKDSWVDAVKGIAMCGVLMIHSGANSLPGIIGKIGAAGSHGVQIFYVVSACLVFASLERYHQEKNAIKIQSRRTLLAGQSGQGVCCEYDFSYSASSWTGAALYQQCFGD